MFLFASNNSKAFGVVYSILVNLLKNTVFKWNFSTNAANFKLSCRDGDVLSFRCFSEPFRVKFVVGRKTNLVIALTRGFVGLFGRSLSLQVFPQEGFKFCVIGRSNYLEQTCSWKLLCTLQAHYPTVEGSTF